MRPPLIVDLEEMTPDGTARGRAADGSTVIVEDGIPRERIEVRVASSRRRAVGEVLRIITPSPHRVAPPCPFFGPCGGCQWQHIAYAEQLRLKQRTCERLLGDALGRNAPRVEPTIGSPGAPWGYRNKVHFACTSGDGGLSLGHFRRHSNAILPVTECPVHAPDGNAIAFAIADELRRARVPAVSPDLRRGTLRHIVVRVAAGTPERLATVVVSRRDRRVDDGLRRVAERLGSDVALHVNVHDEDNPYLFGDATRKVRGRSRLREQIGGISYALSPTAFFQTNVAAAQVLVDLVTAAVPADAQTVVDLYAGAGLFALPLAGRGHRVVAVEENEVAVADGVEGRRLNGIDEPRCRFVSASVEDALRHPGLRTADVVVLDPPRSGCERRVLQHVLRRMRPSVVVYVSCNPSALAADLVIARGAGYGTDRVQPVDMFPHTAHIETVAVLRRT